MISIYSDLCMNFEQFQPSIWCTLDCKTTQNVVVCEHWIEILKVVVIMLLLLLMLFDYFWPHKCTSLDIFGRVVFPNILNFLFNHFLLPKYGCLAMVANEYPGAKFSLVLCALQAYGAWTIDMCHIEFCKSITMLDLCISITNSSCVGLRADSNQRH